VHIVVLFSSAGGRIKGIFWDVGGRGCGFLDGMEWAVRSIPFLWGRKLGSSVR
jgi:hypothetical protein